MIGIETIIESPAWRRALPNADALAERCFKAAGARDGRLAGAVALLLTDDAALRTLNRRFRGADAPTNVLAFPSGAPDALGDIALAYETCAREAKDKGASLEGHAAHLIVHGLLHLVGHDHQEDAAADAMERLETEILDALGISNPNCGMESAD